MSRVFNKRALLAVKLLLSALLLLVLFRWVDKDAMVTMMRSADPSFMALSWALGMPVMVISGLRWQMICRILKLPITKIQAVLSYMEGISFNLVLPGAIGGDILRVFRLKPGRGHLQRGISSVIFDRLANLFILMISGVLALPFGLNTGYIWTWALTAFLVFAFIQAIKRMIDLSQDKRMVQLALADFRDIYFKTQNLLPMTAWSVFSQAFAILMVWAAIQAVGIENLNATQVILVAVAALLAAAIPFTYGGLGLREASMIWMLQFYGVDIDHAASAAFLFTAIIFLQAIPGLGIWFFKAVRPG